MTTTILETFRTILFAAWVTLPALLCLAACLAARLIDATPRLSTEDEVSASVQATARIQAYRAQRDAYAHRACAYLAQAVRYATLANTTHDASAWRLVWAYRDAALAAKRHAERWNQRMLAYAGAWTSAVRAC